MTDNPPLFENRDLRPLKGLWAPGNYMRECTSCEEWFCGDKRALSCASCAYKDER